MDEKSSLVFTGVPDWVIVKKFTPHGGQLVKRPVLDVKAKSKFSPTAAYYMGEEDEDDFCCRCNEFIAGHKIYRGNMQRPLCGHCAAWYDDRSRSRARIVTQDTDNPHVQTLVTPSRPLSIDHVAGNLTENEYRFFIGSTAMNDKWSQCRCCKAVLLGASQRKEHKDSHRNDNEERKWHYNCNEKLIAAYRVLRKKGKCLVCKNPMYGKGKWGIPIHSQCVREWKFRRDPYVPLMLEIKQFEDQLR